ncbi:uncharacterized protein LOC117642961 [Thrips palmi]|uniref:Uncharacterized protein LOC117642961 n=1 Tax=Thrips palmi TaxID=161013 RepID=A0A6P8ZKQ0_THRPL|nr:uncharacterized protein LOC117642961 [Thrips palmi]
MVKCESDPDGGGVPGGTAAMLLDAGGGFRLDSDGGHEADALEALTCTSTSASSYSIYKQRIDSMFDETRSLLSGYGYLRGADWLEAAARTEAERRSRKNANAVQARIEKMFAEMSTGGSRSGLVEQRFSVDYLGSVPLVDKVTTLQGLQGPLKDLYFGYRRARRGSQAGAEPATAEAKQCGQQPLWTPGFLEISGNGLRVHHALPDDQQAGSLGQLEQLNPFPRIAVWAAVQFVCRERAATAQAMECAFLPLIPDPAHGGVDKDALFRDLSGAEERDGHRAPMFAVVMRGKDKAGASRQLECHGFVCASSEDAIIMAANLYQALMASMRTAAANGIGRLSIAGSVCGDGPAADSGSGLGSITASLSGAGTSAESSCSNVDRTPEDAASLAALQATKQAARQPVKQPVKQPIKQGAQPKRGSPPPLPKVPPPVPKRPPRKKKTSGSSTDGEDLIVLEDTSELPRNGKATVSSIRGSYLPRAGGGDRSGGGPGRSAGMRRSQSGLIPTPEVGCGTGSSAPGDILTKVAIPRSHSFLNANGPLTRYSRRPPSHTRPPGTVDPTAGSAALHGGGGMGRAGGGGGGSPLGFNELFTEFRQQEGLDSLDDILGAIIDAEGMSFNDLKPIYKEFLLKLALTLTKDELYHRSKAIMRRQRKKQLLGAGRSSRRRGIAYTAVYIKKAVRRSINKLRPSKRLGLGKLLFSDKAKAAAPKAKVIAHKSKCKKRAKPVAVVSSSSISSYPSSNFRMSRRPSISVSQAANAACNVNVNVSINNRAASNVTNVTGNKARLPRRRSSRRSSRHHQSALPPPVTSTSEDSDFFTMIRCDSARGGRPGAATAWGTKGGAGTAGGTGGGMNRSSSGYVSCSDCSYDSESCTCLSAERCYCSLSKYRPHPGALPGKLPNGLANGLANGFSDRLSSLPPTALSGQPHVCGCDTDSCQGSDKCYCTQRTHKGDPLPSLAPSARQRRGSSASAVHMTTATATPPPANIFEQLRQQGFAASDSSLSRAESPMTAWCKNESRVSHGARHRGSSGGNAGGERRRQRAASSAGSMRSSRSLEFLQGPLLGHLQGQHLLPQQQYPGPQGSIWDRPGGKPPKGKGKASKASKASKQSPSKAVLDGFGSARSRCPSRMDMYRSSSRSCSYVAAAVLEPLGLGHSMGSGRHGRSRSGSTSGLGLGPHQSRAASRAGSRPCSRPCSRPSSRAGSHSGSWVCEDEDADEPVDETVDEDDVHLLLGDASSSSRRQSSRLQARQARQQRKVLVVSARDPTGRVIYMGSSASASANGASRARQDRQDAAQGLGQAVKAGQFFPRASLSHGSSSRRQSRGSMSRNGLDLGIGLGVGHAALTAKTSDRSDSYPDRPNGSITSMAVTGEALSVKKSAEIAALFTGVKVSQTTDIVATARSTDCTVTDSRDSSTTTGDGDGEDMVYSSLDGRGQGQGGPGGQAQRARPGMYLSHTVSVGSSLENSLGYLP